jgi:hypothetical protein
VGGSIGGKIRGGGVKRLGIISLGFSSTLSGKIRSNNLSVIWTQPSFEESKTKDRQKIRKHLVNSLMFSI